MHMGANTPAYFDGFMHAAQLPRPTLSTHGQVVVYPSDPMDCFIMPLMDFIGGYATYSLANLTLALRRLGDKNLIRAVLVALPRGPVLSPGKTAQYIPPLPSFFCVQLRFHRHAAMVTSHGGEYKRLSCFVFSISRLPAKDIRVRNVAFATSPQLRMRHSH